MNVCLLKELDKDFCGYISDPLREAEKIACEYNFTVKEEEVEFLCTDPYYASTRTQ